MSDNIDKNINNANANINSMIVLHAQNVSKTFNDASQPIRVLHGVDLQLHAGERVAILGASGSGKSTLLHVLGGLDIADAGSVVLAGKNWASFKENERAAWRNAKVGFVYQFHHLLPEFTALENIAMPLLWRGMNPKEANAQATFWLNKVGLAERANHVPAMLSGGERQRVAVARALVGNPAVVFADEPTGNLDRENAERVFAMMLQLAQEIGTAFVVVTHDEALAARCDRALRMEHGVLV